MILTVRSCMIATMAPQNHDDAVTISMIPASNVVAAGLPTCTATVASSSAPRLSGLQRGGETKPA